MVYSAKPGYDLLDKYAYHRQGYQHSILQESQRCRAKGQIEGGAAVAEERRSGSGVPPRSKSCTTAGHWRGKWVI